MGDHFPLPLMAAPDFEEDGDRFDVIDAGCGDERLVYRCAGVDQKLGHLGAMRHGFPVEHDALEQSGMAL